MADPQDWLRCLDCGHVWDDLNPGHEVCDCFDRLGRRRSEQLSTIKVQYHFANTKDSTRG
jgi:hypothetical protein